jgi:hypothetical protein
MVDNIQEDSIKMSIKLYPSLKKTDNWQDEYHLNVLTTTSMYSTEDFF